MRLAVGRHLDRLSSSSCCCATGSAARPRRPGVPGGVFWGALAGFTSFISHAGAPPFQVYVMPQNLKPRVFAGTATMFFAAVNLLKLPPYFLLGQFSRDNLAASADAHSAGDPCDLRRRLAGAAGLAPTDSTRSFSCNVPYRGQADL